MDVIALLLSLILGWLPGDAAADKKEKKAHEEVKRASAPWPMHCNFIVRTIDGPGDTVVVVAKRDCD